MTLIKKLPAALALFTLASHAYATNGYYTHGIGTHNKAMAGAGTASPTQAIDASTNPAAGILVGDTLDVGLALFIPERSYTTGDSLVNGNFGAFTLGGGKVDSGNEKHLIPYLAKTWLIDENNAITGLMYGRGGMNTDYSDGTATFDPDGPGPAPVMTLDGTYGAGPTGVNLAQGFLEVAWSWKCDTFALGVSPMLAVQAFDIDGVGSFAPYTKTFAASGGTQMPQDLTNNGHDMSWGLGVRVGGIWQVSEVVSLAASYQTEIDMKEFDDYSDLFAEGGDFDIPASLRAGISFAATQNLNLHVDVEHTWFSDVSSVGNELARVFSCPTAGAGGMDVESCAGGNRGLGFGWDDVTTYKFALDWTPASMPHVTWMLGYSTTDQPIQSDDVLINVLAPAVVEEHFTAGVAWTLESGNQLSASFMYAPEKSVSGTNAFDPTQQLKLQMSQTEFEIAYTFK